MGIILVFDAQIVVKWRIQPIILYLFSIGVVVKRTKNY